MKQGRTKNAIVERALEALIKPEIEGDNFDSRIRHLTLRDFNETLQRIPEDRLTDPKAYFKTVKALSRLNKSSTIVEGFVDKGKNISVEDGLKKIVLDLYCPRKKMMSYIAVDIAAEK